MKKTLFLLILLSRALFGGALITVIPQTSDPQRDPVEVTIGAGDQQGNVPLNMYYRTSLFETIYLSQEMNIGGTISAIRFYNNFFEPILASPTQLWLGETGQTDLSGGWIPSSQLTQVFSGNVDYPSGINQINITFDTPFTYGGGNLVLMAFRPWENEFYLPMDAFYCQINGNSRSLTVFNSNMSINPDNPPVTATSGLFPKTTFFVTVTGMGSATGTVSSGGQPLDGAIVAVQNSVHTTQTDAQGHYSFPYLPFGNYTVSAVKTGYHLMTQPLTVVEGQQTTLDFALVPYAQISITGRVVGSDNITVGISGAQVRLEGYAPFLAIADASGVFTIAGVYAMNSYTLIASAAGYDDHSQVINVGNGNIALGDIVLNEIAYPPRNVAAVENTGGNSVTIAWEAPQAAQEGWLHYDDGSNYNSFGTAGSMSFDVAIRYPASVLMPYAGASLQTVKMWPAQGGAYRVRVWTGGNASAPAQMVVDQPVIPSLNSYNTVQLNDPVLITGNEELWFGFLCDTTGMNPAYAGVDDGPAVNGFGNMIHWQDAWTTLLAVNSFCDFNWNIQGYAGMNPPAPAPEIMPATVFGGRDRIDHYKVWRCLQGQENNEASWTMLTPQAISADSYLDSGWNALPDGTYLWAVKAIYTNNVISQSAFSNTLTKITQMGTIAGVVRDIYNAPLPGATVTCGAMTATTNATGAYSMLVNAGVWDVTASRAGYVSHTNEDMIVVTGQTTTCNFALEPITPADDPNAPPLATGFVSISPNPFNGFVTIAYSLKQSGAVALEIFNTRGQLVRTLASGNKDSGFYSVRWDGKDGNSGYVPAGVYLCRLTSGKDSAQTKIIKY
jgi:hypothetical protein